MKRMLLSSLAGCLISQSTLALDATLIGRYASNVYDESAAEIVAFHANSHRIFVVNANDKTVDVLDASTMNSSPIRNTLSASTLSKQNAIDLQKDMPDLTLGAANSVAVYGNLLAVAVEAKPKQQNGVVAFYILNETGDASFSGYRVVGALPDMVTFTPNGKQVVVANEGEPSKDYMIDPEGSIAIIDIVNGAPSEEVSIAGFSAFNDNIRKEVRVFGPGASVAQDLEPEYITVSSDSNTAFVALQENNALAVVDLRTKVVTDVLPLGFKDYGSNAIDASDKDQAINFNTYRGVYGMYQPDSITSITIDGKDFILTANEGDARDYWFDAADESACLAAGGKKFDDEDGCLAYSEETRAGKVEIEGDVLDSGLTNDKQVLGRLKITQTLGDADNNGKYETLYSYGARSFSVWNTAGELVWDSGEQIGRITAYALGSDFNNTDNKNKGDSRSDDKGAEPEAISAGYVKGVPYAFVGLERTGGFLIYDLTNPKQPKFVSYQTNRDYSVKDPLKAGDLAPEGMAFVNATDSPTGNALLIIGHEVSGSTSVYELY